MRSDSTPLPRYIVDAIVARTLGPAILGRSPEELAEFTVADVCCGSGVFLLSVYEFLLDHYLSWYLANDLPANIGKTVYEVVDGQWRLTYDVKRRILLNHLRGVDIDSNAAEVARFSLSLKLIEDESATGLQEYVTRTRNPALPDLETTIRSGNSLVSGPEWDLVRGSMSLDLRDKINPFTWQDEFTGELENGGFDVIVGNPPYIRIQNMATYSPEEVAFYKATNSPYLTAQQDNFDKYAPFIERSFSLLRPSGRLGVIVPHKFMMIQSGRTLRRLLTSGHFLEEVVHFGAKQVFGPGTSNYTCILILDRRGKDRVRIEETGALEAWRYGEPGLYKEVPAIDLTEEAWQFVDTGTRALFDRVRMDVPDRLGELAEIFVGLQTSADSVYIFESISETPTTVTFHRSGQDWTIEREILRPCLQDVTLFAYKRPQPNAWMIFPYEISTSESSKARLIGPDDLAARFPGCWSYLNAHRSLLENRNITKGLPPTASGTSLEGRRALPNLTLRR